MLSYERIGSGPPLVLIHGIGHRRQAWYPIVDRVGEKRELILVDLPGHGRSGPLVSSGRPILEVMHSYFQEFMEAAGLRDAHVAGNSLGGRIALEAGVSGLARSVTALSPAGFWRSGFDFAYTRGLFGAVEAVSRVIAPVAPRLVESSVGRSLMFNWISAKPSRLSASRALGDYQAFGEAAPAMAEIMGQASRFDGVIPPHIPVTIGWGALDVVLPRYQARIARSVLPDADVFILPGCGHVPMSDDPELVSEILLRGSAEESALASVG